MESNNAKRSHPSRGDSSSGSLPAWKWTGAEALELVHELNEHCLEMLEKLAERPTEEIRVDGAFEIVRLHRDLWRRLDKNARRRAARCPFLLVNVKFQNETWWRSAKDDCSEPHKDADTASFFPAKTARELMGETLMLAWLTARSDPRTATLLLGLAPTVAEIIASLRPRDIRRIVAQHSRQLRPRWEASPRFWQQLLVAAKGGNDSSLIDVHLNGLQLLGAELIPTCRSGHA